MALLLSDPALAAPRGVMSVLNTMAKHKQGKFNRPHLTHDGLGEGEEREEGDPLGDPAGDPVPVRQEPFPLGLGPTVSCRKFRVC
jgi:hypothetical protein